MVESHQQNNHNLPDCNNDEKSEELFGGDPLDLLSLKGDSSQSGSFKHPKLDEEITPISLEELEKHPAISSDIFNLNSIIDERISTTSRKLENYHTDLLIKDGYQSDRHDLTLESSKTLAPPLLSQAIFEVTSSLSKFTKNNNATAILQKTFGKKWNTELAFDLIQDIVNGRAPIKFELISGAIASGAFSSDNNTIYLAQEFLDSNAKNLDTVTKVLLEEIGHYLDSQLNQTDSPGDEGAIFSALVGGEKLSSIELKALKERNDLSTLTIDGKEIEIETSEIASFRSATVNGEVFLGGNYLELGINSWGSLGSINSKPNNFYGTNTRNTIGITGDDDGFGLGEDLRRDYFMPGSEEERWAIGYKIDGSTVTASNAAVYDTTDIPNSIENTSSGDELSVQSTGIHDNKLKIVQNISFGVDDKFFKNTVTLTNISAQTLDSVRYMRSFDPDNTKDLGGEYTTDNIVEATIAEDEKAVVKAQTYSVDDPVYQQTGSRSPIFLYSKDSRAVASTFGFDNSDPYVPLAYDAPSPKGVLNNADEA
ncbi:MAG: hypothetical protein ACRC2V_27555, partial [Xenococcaceae cyanobacterium]